MPNLPEAETMIIVSDVVQGSDTQTICYIEDDYIGEMVPEISDEQQPILQELTYLFTRIDSTPSPPPQDDELLPEINQVS